MKNVIFRADASSEIGAGHVLRCTHLANVLVTKGWHCTLAGKSETFDLFKKTVSWPGGKIALDGTQKDEPELIQKISHHADWDLMICDHYQRGIAFETACRSWTSQIAIIDDLPARNHDADILIDQTYGRAPNEYKDLLPDGCQVLAGASYALLGRDFRELREMSLSRRNGQVEKLLVSVGGSDPNKITSTIIKAINQTGLRLQSDIIIGPMAKETEQIMSNTQYMDPKPKIHFGTSKMAQLMSEADLAIGVTGTTSWERCCLGLPSITMTAANNQKDNARALSDAGASLFIGDVAEVQAEDIAKNLVKLVTNQETLRLMSVAASIICDGVGAERVATILDQNFDTHNVNEY